MKRSSFVRLPVALPGARGARTKDERYYIAQWNDALRRALAGDADGWTSLALIAAEGEHPLFPHPDRSLAIGILRALIEGTNDADAMLTLASLLETGMSSSSQRAEAINL